jgi:hypothetical protein
MFASPVYSQLADNPIFIEIIPHYEEPYTENVGEPCGTVSIDLEGYVTYKIYLCLQDENDCVQAIFGSDSTGVPFDCTPDGWDMYFDVDCGVFQHPLADHWVTGSPCLFMDLHQSMVWDSFMTLGVDCSTTGTEITHVPLPCDQPYFDIFEGNDGDCDFFDGGDFIMDSNAWFNVSGYQAGPDLKVLIAQITTCGDLCMSFGVQLLDDCIPGEPLVYTPDQINTCQLNPCTNFPTTVLADDSFCDGAPGTVTFAEGGYGYTNYQLHDSETDAILSTFDEVSGEIIFSNLALGSYYISTIDSIGCRDTSDVFSVIGLPDDFVPLSGSGSIVSDISCASESDGSIALECNGGFGMVSAYMLVNDTSGFALPCDTLLTGLSCGTYAIQWTDEMGCQVNTELILNCPDSLGAVAEWTDVSCYGLSDGSVTLDYTGGTGSLTLTFLDPGEPQTIEGLASPGEIAFDNLMAEEYVFNIVDANGCEITDTVTISSPDPLEGIMSYGNEVLGNDGWACVEVTGGNGGYSYEWSSGSTEDCAESLMPGIYSVEITDSLGCSWFGETEVFAGVSDVGDISDVLSVWPSPAGDWLYFTWEGNYDGLYQIRVMDMAGRQVMTSMLNHGEPFYIGSLAAGMYSIVIEISGQVFVAEFSK